MLHPFWHLLYVFTKTTDLFIVQNIILFEHLIQISLWARMIRYDGKMRKLYVQNCDLRRLFTTLTWCMLCWWVSKQANFRFDLSFLSLTTPDLNPCAPPSDLWDIELCGTRHRRNKQQYRPLLFPVEVTDLGIQEDSECGARCAELDMQSSQ